MRRWIFVMLGGLLAIAGIVFTLQGLNLLGGSGGMNGQRAWAVIGPVIAVVGVALAWIGSRGGRRGRGRPAPR